MKVVILLLIVLLHVEGACNGGWLFCDSKCAGDDSATAMCGQTIAVRYRDNDGVDMNDYRGVTVSWPVNVQGDIAYWTAPLSAQLFTGFLSYRICGDGFNGAWIETQWRFAVQDRPTPGTVAVAEQYIAHPTYMDISWGGFGNSYGCGQISNYRVDIVDLVGTVVYSQLVGVTNSHRVSPGTPLQHGNCYYARVSSQMVVPETSGATTTYQATAQSGICTRVDMAPPTVQTATFRIPGESTPVYHPSTKAQSYGNRIVLQWAPAVVAYAPVAYYVIAVGYNPFSCSAEMGTIQLNAHTSPYTITWPSDGITRSVALQRWVPYS
eukprot:TRINITY_DN2568_c0_g1_i2.p1 TRINITY_DN2568_c0_g1~~TRINITY_DN2568_c0_g1_i2.p1  ORF type:complete len:336 (-),score=22.33 TRINITY_DN2568_c0_g1_i2:1003-1971(-)